MSMASAAVTTEIDDGVAVLRLDDGKVNVLSYDVLDALGAGLDRAEAEAEAVCIVGREGAFSAGFDLSVMGESPDAARRLVAHGGRLFLRIFMHPQPVVAAVTGHALAGGVLMAISCDLRIGAEVGAKIGLNELGIGMPLPLFALVLARDRLDPRVLDRATLGAELYDPAGAVTAGYLDRVLPAASCVAEAVAEARRLGAYSSAAYSTTKRTMRQPLVDRVLAEGAADLAQFTIDG